MYNGNRFCVLWGQIFRPSFALLCSKACIVLASVFGDRPVVIVFDFGIFPLCMCDFHKYIASKYKTSTACLLFNYMR